MRLHFFLSLSFSLMLLCGICCSLSLLLLSYIAGLAQVSLDLHVSLTPWNSNLAEEFKNDPRNPNAKLGGPAAH